MRNNIKIGYKVKIDKILPFWYTDVIENAEKLDKNKEYTVSKISLASSWTSICLD